MQHEHEEAMRVDFAERVRLNVELWHAELLNQRNADTTEDERRRDAIDSRWEASSHVEQWIYLKQVHFAWAEQPDRAREYMAWVDHHRDLGHDVIDAVQQRSLEQARELSGNTFAVNYERNAPDSARFTPATPVPTFGAIRRRPIERSR